MEISLKKQEDKGMVLLVLYVFTLGFALCEPLISLVVFVVVMWVILDRNIKRDIGFKF